VLHALSSYPSSLDHSNYVWRGLQIVKLLIMQFSPTSRHIITLLFIYFPQCALNEERREITLFIIKISLRCYAWLCWYGFFFVPSIFHATTSCTSLDRLSAIAGSRIWAVPLLHSLCCFLYNTAFIICSVAFVARSEVFGIEIK
jgi:hypothetical protein